MKLFNLEWLTGKSKEKEKQLEEENNKLKQELQEAIDKVNEILEAPDKTVEEEKKPYDKLLCSNGVVTVIMHDGRVLSKINASLEDYANIKNANTEFEIERLVLSSEEKQEQKPKEEYNSEKEVVSNLLDSFKGNPDFDVIGEEVFLKGINLPLPTVISGAFIKMIEEKKTDTQEYKSLKFFTMKLLANPIKESRESLLRFVKEEDIQLTNSGNMVGYRRIVSRGKGDKSKTSNISNYYVKIKGQRKSPKNYNVYKNPDGSLFLADVKKKSNKKKYAKNELVGNLSELYSKLGEMEENIFTDNHTKTYEIKVGEIYRIKESDINKNLNGSCGGFLHVASKYGYNYKAFGDTDVMVIINPMFAAKMDTGYSGKIGVTEMFVACIINENEVAPDVIQFDEEYDKMTLEAMENELKAKHLNLFSVTDDVTVLSHQTLEFIRQQLANRIVKV